MFARLLSVFGATFGNNYSMFEQLLLGLGQLLAIFAQLLHMLGQLLSQFAQLSILFHKEDRNITIYIKFLTHY